MIDFPKRIIRTATLGSKCQMLSFVEHCVNQLLLCVSIGLEYICLTRRQAIHSGI